MFPNDDICNVRAAKNAARRIFERYTPPAQKQTPSSGLGQQEVSSLIKNAYKAINITYDPSSNDVSSFMSVFGVGDTGKIDLDKIQQLAVKYLCGEDAMMKQFNNRQPETRQQSLIIQTPKVEQNNSTKQRLSIDLANDQTNIISFKNGGKKTQSPTKGYKFFTPRVNQSKNYFSSKQGSKIQSHNQKQPKKTEQRLTYSQILNRANQIFNQNKNKQTLGITINEAPEVLFLTYQLMGKSKYNPSQDDVKIWIKLCDPKRSGIVQWASYQNFVKRLMERDNISELK